MIHADHLNTPRVIVDSTGTPVWRWRNHNAFGDNPPDEDPDGDGVKFKYNLRFAGQYFDTETGLHYNYFRDYDPKTGRYLSSDPIGLAGGLNPYLYARANPLYYYDPDGLFYIPFTDIWVPAGEEYGAQAAQYWADRQIETGNPLYSIPGLLASLWTPETSTETASTLCGGTGVGRYSARPF